MFLMSHFQRVLGNAVALLALLGIIIPTTWLAFDRDPPVVLLSGEAIPSTVLKGGAYKLKWVPKHTGRACPGMVNWVFVDSEGTTWTQAKAESELDYRILVSAEKAVVGREHIMPTGASAEKGGVGTLHTSADFRCNFTQWDWWFFDIPIHVDYPDVKIKVIALPPTPMVPGPAGPTGPQGPKGDPATK
jgi:hypothetical protein